MKSLIYTIFIFVLFAVSSCTNTQTAKEKIEELEALVYSNKNEASAPFAPVIIAVFPFNI